MPEKWLTLNKTLHPTIAKNQPIQTTTCTFRTLPNGTVETCYERETPLQDTPSCFPSSFSISTPLHISPPLQREYDDVPINYFDSQGAPVYAFSNPIIGHKYWNLCDCNDYYENAKFDVHYEKRAKKSTKRNSCKEFQARFD
ncbi:hypothetical protein Patl1_37644 [Pistacia atlantica]|nr:hypothetical protein Patl1_37644 [Pistacia atlantica]